VSTDKHIVRIVVGVSGVSNSTATLRWAGQEAQLHCAQIWAVYAWSSPMEMLVPYAPRRGVPSLDQQQEASSALLTFAIEYALGSNESWVVAWPPLVGCAPIPALFRYAAGAHIFVLGRELRSGHLDGVALGVVAGACISHVRCSTALFAGTEVVVNAENSPFPGWPSPWDNNHSARRWWRYDNKASNAG
jgi:hypothetical protein